MGILTILRDLATKKYYIIHIMVVIFTAGGNGEQSARED